MFGAWRSSQKIIAVADIGTGSAGVALVMLKNGEPARLIAGERIVLPFEDRTRDATVKGVIAGLGQAAEKVLAAHAAGADRHLRVASVYAVVHAPWTASNTLHAESVFEKEMRITSAMIGEVAQQALSDDKGLNRETLMESAVARVELNGYQTGSPVGKSAHSLAVAVLATECDIEIQEGVEDALGRAFLGTKPVFRSGARAVLSILRALPKGANDYVILDMEDEASIVIVVRQGLACEQIVIPEGTRSILKRVTEKGMPEETLSLIRMLERDECASGACDSISAAMGKAEIDLSKIFGDSLTRIANPTRLPADLILLAHPDLRGWLSRFFARIDFTQCTVTAQPFSVHALAPEDLADLAVSETAAAADLELLVSSALVNIEENA